MFERFNNLKERVTDAVDLMIDFTTLGEYGLETPATAAKACAPEASGRCEQDGLRAGWEAVATSRRGSCAAEDRRLGATPTRRRRDLQTH